MSFQTAALLPDKLLATKLPSTAQPLAAATGIAPMSPHGFGVDFADDSGEEALPDSPGTSVGRRKPTFAVGTDLRPRGRSQRRADTAEGEASVLLGDARNRSKSCQHLHVSTSTVRAAAVVSTEHTMAQLECRGPSHHVLVLCRRQRTFEALMLRDEFKRAAAAVEELLGDDLSTLLPYRPAVFDRLRGVLDPKVGARLLCEELQKLTIRELQARPAADMAHSLCAAPGRRLGRLNASRAATCT